jgi:hypothetical protein
MIGARGLTSSRDPRLLSIGRLVHEVAPVADSEDSGRSGGCQQYSTLDIIWRFPFASRSPVLFVKRA